MVAFLRKIARDDGKPVGAVVAEIVHGQMLASFEDAELREAETGRRPDLTGEARDRLVPSGIASEKALTADEVKRMRSELGLSQRNLANKLGVDVMTVSRWERGKIVVGRWDMSFGGLVGGAPGSGTVGSLPSAVVKTKAAAHEASAKSYFTLSLPYPVGLYSLRPGWGYIHPKRGDSSGHACDDLPVGLLARYKLADALVLRWTDRSAGGRSDCWAPAFSEGEGEELSLFIESIRSSNKPDKRHRHAMHAFDTLQALFDANLAVTFCKDADSQGCARKKGPGHNCRSPILRVQLS